MCPSPDDQTFWLSVGEDFDLVAFGRDDVLDVSKIATT
jgi:hypothetical protein